VAWVGDEAQLARTDLAVEAKAVLDAGEGLPGVEETVEEPSEGVHVSRVAVTSPEGARALRKPEGRYVTVTAPGLRRHDPEHAARVGRVLTREIALLLPGRPRSVLVVGLGNWHATADALGPKVVGRLLVTRHLHEVLPEAELRGLGSVAAFSPGVLGLTGVETAEVVLGLCDRIRPELVIAVDALAALDVGRILTTVQLTDTGIAPGSGVGSRRRAIAPSTLGCGVLAIGVPTVVHAATIAEAALERVLGEEGRKALGAARPTLAEVFGDLVVTPKEIDRQVEDLARLVAGALNAALHPEVDLGEYALFA
jgi:spore protease